MANNQTEQKKSGGLNLQALGFNSPMEIIDLLALIKVDGVPVISDDSACLNPKTKTEHVLRFFQEKFGVKAPLLPYVASIIKKNLKTGKIRWSN
jgi:hypothetical protein